MNKTTDFPLPLTKKKLKIYRSSFDLYSDFLYFNNAFHLPAPKEVFKTLRSHAGKLKLISFQYQGNNKNENTFVKFCTDKVKKLWKSMYECKENQLYFFNSLQELSFFLSGYYKKRINISDLNNSEYTSQNSNFPAIIPFINPLSGKRAEKTEILRESILDLSLFFNYIPLNFESLLNNYNSSALVIDLNQSFGIPFKGYALYTLRPTDTESDFIPNPFMLSSIEGMIRFFKKFGPKKLINLTGRNYYYLHGKFKTLENRLSAYSVPELDNKYNPFKTEYSNHYESTFIPLSFSNREIYGNLCSKLDSNRIIYSKNEKEKTIIISPSFYNSFEEITLLLDIFRENL